MSNFFKLLELDENSTWEQVKKQRAILSKQWHPDKNGSDTTERFKEIQDAYEKLQAYFEEEPGQKEMLCESEKARKEQEFWRQVEKDRQKREQRTQEILRLAKIEREQKEREFWRQVEKDRQVREQRTQTILRGSAKDQAAKQPTHDEPNRDNLFFTRG